ncbi:DUF302 domain-containing protein [uncultured Brevundimonas sp.]|uniref:DUF302 domain-containing protein n=1 Tax=uncultured Brevundimonas sp. TaxID=213418 RepID=UPI0030EC4047|tara:strand:+ start:32829 stop:33359 length:531 start_codon:yes stop_codon:yes gene_type:complete
MTRPPLTLLLGALLAACTPAAAPEAPPEAATASTTVAAPAIPEADAWVEKTSPDPVADTVARLTAAIESSGASVVAVVDHRANAAKAGLDLPETTVVMFGNPAVGTPLMLANRRAALDLPLEILVWRDGETTRIGYLPAPALAERHGIAPSHPSIAAMTAALNKLTDAAAGTASPT